MSFFLLCDPNLDSFHCSLRFFLFFGFFFVSFYLENQACILIPLSYRSVQRKWHCAVDLLIAMKENKQKFKVQWAQQCVLLAVKCCSAQLLWENKGHMTTLGHRFKLEVLLTESIYSLFLPCDLELSALFPGSCHCSPLVLNNTIAFTLDSFSNGARQNDSLFSLETLRSRSYFCN